MSLSSAALRPSSFAAGLIGEVDVPVDVGHHDRCLQRVEQRKLPRQ
jgi:hypothetical protein